MIKYSTLALSLAIVGSASAAHASADLCATFFWTGSHNQPVARYQPRYLIGEGLEDVGMSQIPGTRIRYKWSQQAASCLASSNSWGYFSNVAFNQTTCGPEDGCTGTRFKRLSERLVDVRDAVVQMSTPNADPTYQASLDRAKTSSFLVIDTMANATTSTASFLGGLAADYNQILSQVDLVLSLALPASLRTAVLDQLCSADNVAQLGDLETQCVDNDQYCDLFFLFDAINDCVGYQNGATLDAMVAQLTATRAGLVTERDAITAEQQSITSLWTEIQSHR